MYCKFQILSNGEWVNFGRLTYPLNLGETVTADTSSAYSVTIYMKGETELALESLTPGTLCRINFGTRIYWFVVIDGGRVAPRAGLSFCFHAYTIQEALCYAREIYVQSAFFSNGLYTVPQFFTRLFALSESDLEQVLSTNDAYDLLVENWQSPDYQVASNSMLDNLIKIGQNNQVRFKARINTEGQLEYYAKSLKGDTALTTINGRKVGESKQYLGANYASRVVANVQNLANDEYRWIPNERIAAGLRATPAENYELEISSGEAVIKTPLKILGANKVRVLGFGRVITNSNTPWPGYVGTDYRVFNPDGTQVLPDSGKYVSIDRDQISINGTYEFKVLSRQEWALLDPDDSQGATYHQQNTLYFVQGENSIRNIAVCNGAYEALDNAIQNTAVPIYYIEVWYGGALQNTYEIRSELKWHLNRYIFNGKVYIDGIFSTHNSIVGKRVTHYSQEDNIVSGKSLIDNMQNYIDSMKNSEEHLSYEFDSIDDLPEVGSILNGKVIATINFECTNKKIIATMTLSDELVKKSEHYSADVGLDLPTINVDKAFERHTTYNTTMWFCASNEEAQALVDTHGADEYINFLSGYIQKLLESFSNGRTSPAMPLSIAYIKMGEHESEAVYSAIEVNFAYIGHVLVASFRTLDNLIVGTKADNGLGNDPEDLRYFPVRYIGESGQSKIATFMLITAASSASFPDITESEFNSASPFFTIRDEKYYHDPAEVVNLTYQLQAKVFDNKGKVYETFWRDNGFFSDFSQEEDQYTRMMSFKPDGTSTFIECGAIEDIQVNLSTSKAMVMLGMSLSPLAVNDEVIGTIKVWRRHNVTSEDEMMFLGRATGMVVGPEEDKYLVMYVAFTK